MHWLIAKEANQAPAVAANLVLEAVNLIRVAANHNRADESPPVAAAVSIPAGASPEQEILDAMASPMRKMNAAKRVSDEAMNDMAMSAVRVAVIGMRVATNKVWQWEPTALR